MGQRIGIVIAPLHCVAQPDATIVIGFAQKLQVNRNAFGNNFRPPQCHAAQAVS